MKSPVTMLDVANAAGVSKASVSNVLNHPERVRPGLRKRIEAAAQSLGYSGPDPKGRLLSSGKVNAIGFVPSGAYGICAAFSSAYMRDLLHGVSQVCEDYGASLTLVSTTGAVVSSSAAIRGAIVDGFILGSIEEAEFAETARRRNLPFVLMDEDGGSDASSVRIDDRGGARQATEHLIELGHRRFVVMTILRREDRAAQVHVPTGSPPRFLAAYPIEVQRLKGVADALSELGISINDVPIVESGAGPGTSIGSAREGAALLFDNLGDATAIVALADALALAALDEASRRGIDVPNDLSVVGFDDVPEAALARPPLTTIAQPTEEKGRVAARLLFEGGPPRQVVLPVSLVVRSSTAPPRA